MEAIKVVYSQSQRSGLLPRPSNPRYETILGYLQDSIQNFYCAKSGTDFHSESLNQVLTRPCKHPKSWFNKYGSKFPFASFGKNEETPSSQISKVRGCLLLCAHTSKGGGSKTRIRTGNPPRDSLAESVRCNFLNWSSDSALDGNNCRWRGI